MVSHCLTLLVTASLLGWSSLDLSSFSLAISMLLFLMVAYELTLDSALMDSSGVSLL